MSFLASLRQAFLTHVAQTSPFPLSLEIERAEGVYLYAADGMRYLDLISGIAVSSVGHCAPEVVAAVQAQAGRFLHTMVYGEYVLGPQVALATLLAQALGAGLESVYFVNSGAEATEGAMKLAKRATGRTQIAAFADAYHGSTQGALSISDSWIREGYGPFLPDTLRLRFNAPADLAQITERTAAVFVEAVQGEAGAVVAAPGYLAQLRARCDAVGALLVFDEIQTGFGRTGHLFAFQGAGVRPDIVLLAKGMGGGMPIGAFAAAPGLMAALMRDPMLGHITTFGGHPVCCAAALASLQKIQREGLVARVPGLEALLHARLGAHPLARGLRGAGLMQCLLLRDFDHTLAVVQACLRRGVITDWFLNFNAGLRIAPPLTITEAELHTACDVIAAALQDVG